MLRQWSWLIAATVISQGLQLLGILILARSFSPAQLGFLSQFTALLLAASAGAALSLPSAFVLTNSVVRRILLLQLSLCSALFVALLAPLLYWLLAAEQYQNFQQLFAIGPALAIGVLASSAVSSLQQLHYARQRFIAVAQLSILLAIMYCLIRAVAGVSQLAIAWLLWAAVVLPVLHALCLFTTLPASQRYQLARPLQLRFGLIKRLLWRYRDFVCYQTPQQYLNVFSQNLPLLMIGSWFGAAQAGYYGLCIALLGAPALLINRSIGEQLYPKFASIRSNAVALRQLYYKVTGLLALVMLPAFIVLLIWHQPLVQWGFGLQWQQAATYAAILAPWFFMVALNSPSLKIIILLRRQRFTLLLNVITLLLRVGVLFFCWQLGKPVLFAIVGLSVIGVMHNLLVLVLADVAIRQSRLTGALLQKDS